MENWDAFKYFLINLGLHNLVLVLVSGALGVLLGRLLWSRSAQGLTQLRERLAAEGERAKTAEAKLQAEQERYRSLREQLDEGDGTTVVVNSPELEEEVEALRTRSREADATLEQMMLANAALEQALKELEEEAKTREEADGREDAPAEVSRLKAEVESLRSEAKAAEAEREALELELKRLQKQKPGTGRRGDANERVAALEMQLLEARHERKQVEEASAILRKELYAMRHELEELEKRQSLEKELDQALHEAEQRLARLQAEMARGARTRGGAGAPPAAAAETSAEDAPEDASAEHAPARDSAVATAATGDDLTRLKGVGEVLAGRLREAGITSFRQIADWSDEEVGEISAQLSLGRRVEQGRWREQARELAGD